MIDHRIPLQGEDFTGYFNTPRLHLLDLLLTSSAPGRVLEVGCGAGANLVELKRRFPAVHTTGIECHAGAADCARATGSVDVLLEQDVLALPESTFASGSFDLLVFSHVLEHFAEPAQVIHRTLPWLHPQGRLLVALPNVRHVSVVFELLIRRDFRYRPEGGVLDETHLRFFTRKSALRWFDELGLHPVRHAADIDGVRSRLFLNLSLGLAGDLAAFAHNFVLRRK